MVTTVTGKRQITIPAEIAANLGIVTGTRIEWSADPKRGTATLTVKPGRKALLQSLRAIGRKYRETGESAGTILDRERDRDDADRIRELSVAEDAGPYSTRRKGRKP